MTSSTCCYCGVGCGVRFSEKEDRPWSVVGDEQHPVNAGLLCSKGQNLHHVVQDTSDRLLFPQIRKKKGQPTERIGWDEAINVGASVLKETIAKHGPDSVGIYVSGQCLTEEYYLANKLCKGFWGTNNIDTNSRLCMSSAVVGYKKSLGEDSPPISYEDIEEGDCYLVSGANPAICHPILFRRMEKRILSGEARMIVVDPRKTETAKMAELHLQILPGGDVHLHNALALGCLKRGLIDQNFIREHVSGWSELKTHLESLNFDDLCSMAGLSTNLVEKAIDIISQSEGLLSFWAMGLNQSAQGVDKNLSLINLSLITGRIGKPGSGPFSLTGQPNAMGGREVGGMANLLPCHRDLANEEHRREVAEFWNIPLDRIQKKPGLTAIEMMEAMESGKLKALWVICTNPLVSWPSLERAEDAFAKLPFLMVSEISNRSNTLEYADLILPAAGWTEKEGTMTNSERRITYLPKLKNPPGEARSDSQILMDVAKAMGWDDAFSYKNSEAIFNEHRSLSIGTNVDIGGVSYERLKRGSLQWPCPTHDHPGTKRLFEDRLFFTHDKKAKCHFVSGQNPSPDLLSGKSLVLTTGRLRDQWHTMTLTGKVNNLKRQDPAPNCQIHPEDAKRLGIRNDQLVKVSNSRGEVRLPAKLNTDLRPGVIFLAMHWGKGKNGSSLARSNNLTSTLIDPISKEPDFKFSLVQVTPYKKEPKKIVIVGMGAAALEFVRKMRELGSEDQIIAIGEEPHGFYNRVLLPEYMASRIDWKSLLTTSPDELASLQLETHTSTRVASIERSNRTVLLSNGTSLSYDHLILACGSRPQPPRIPNVELDGVHSLRNRHQAETILKDTKRKGCCVIVGGGLLGLELAGALNDLGFSITIVQRSMRLMRAQLDDRSGQLLFEAIQAKGIRVIFGETVEKIHGHHGRLSSIELSSGARLETESLCFAMGIEARSELAREAGLAVNRGVVVDDRLRSSDPFISAIGEVAEWRGLRAGTTPASQFQAQTLAKLMSGNETEQMLPFIQSNLLKVKDIHLASIGVVDMNQCDELQEHVLINEKTTYQKVMLQGDRIVGAILYGDLRRLGLLQEWIRNGWEMGSKRDDLLKYDGLLKQVSAKGALVCSCHGVGEGNLKACIDRGARDLSSLCRESKAGTGCGSCKPEVNAFLEKTLQVQEVIA